MIVQKLIERSGYSLSSSFGRRVSEKWCFIRQEYATNGSLRRFSNDKSAGYKRGGEVLVRGWAFSQQRCFASSGDESTQPILGPQLISKHLRLAKWDEGYLFGKKTSPASRRKDTEKGFFTNFNVLFLGTSAGVPTVERSCSATLLMLGGLSYLFDAGEGVQRQLMYSHAQLKDIRKIFITHLHGDHVFGLPSLLMQLQLELNARKGVKELDVYGPPGLYNYIASIISLTQVHLSQRCRIIVHELVGGSADPGPSVHPATMASRDRRKRFTHSHYPELSNRSLERRFIRCDDQGVWTLEVPKNLVTKEAILEASLPRSRRFSNEYAAGDDKEVFVTAAEVMHTRGMQTFGYAVKEQDPPIKLDQEKATSLGVAPGMKYRLLANNFAVESDDGTRQVTPFQVRGEHQNRARKFVLIGDNCQLSHAMFRISRDADVLVHEATLAEDQAELVWNRGHSTGGMAGLVAKDVNAKVLLLNHISGRQPPIPVVEEAAKMNDGSSFIVKAQDYLEVRVPYAGFQTPEVHETRAEAEEVADV